MFLQVKQYLLRSLIIHPGYPELILIPGPIRHQERDSLFFNDDLPPCIGNLPLINAYILLGKGNPIHHNFFIILDLNIPHKHGPINHLSELVAVFLGIGHSLRPLPELAIEGV
jgi:hypothetical protein